MELAKQTIDIGIFTNRLEAMQEFYGKKLGLQFESVLPVGGGFKQHRYLANGSVIKLMHTEAPLRRRRPGGYETIMLAAPSAIRAEPLPDPDDNTILLVPPGRDDVTQIELRVGVVDPDVHVEFYLKALGAADFKGNRVKLGESIVAFYHEPVVKKASSQPFANPMEVIQAMAELGIQYITLGVKDCNAAFAEAIAAGGGEAVKPANFGTVARIAFVRDPDGNFIELAQRPAPAA